MHKYGRNGAPARPGRALSRAVSLALAAVVATLAASCGGGGGGGGSSALVFEEFRLDGASHFPRNGSLEVRFNSPIDPESVSETGFAVLRPNGDVFRGRIEIRRDTIEFFPTVLEGDRNDYEPPNNPGINGLGFDPNTDYRIRILGGSPLGIRNKRGSILEESVNLEFTTGFNFLEEEDPVFPTVDEVFAARFEPPPVIDGDPLDPDPARQPLVEARTQRVTVRFSETMDPRTFDPLTSFTVTNITETPEPFPGLGVPIPGEVEWSPDARSFSFEFQFSLGDNPFGPDPWEFALDVAGGLTDLAGFPLSATPEGLPLEGGSFRYFFTSEDDPDEPVFQAFVEDFRTTENFDPDTGPPTAKWLGNGLLEGGELRARSKEFTDQRNRFRLNDPLVGGMVGDPGDNGSRFQMLFTPENTGTPNQGEVLIGMAWWPASNFLFASTYQDVEIRLGHKPGGTIGLDRAYDENYDGSPVIVYEGDYEVPNSLDTMWFDWPDFTSFFEYDGERGLVFEVSVPPGADTFQLFRNISTRSVPRRRNIAPFGSFQATNPGENTTYATRFDFSRIRTIAYSRWQNTGFEFPDYLDPVLDEAPDRPGASIVVEWQGAVDDGQGGPGETTDWFEDIQAIDRFQFFRYRVNLIADPVGGTIPALRSLSVVYEIR